MLGFRIRGRHVRQLGLRHVWENLRSGTGITYAFLLLVVGLVIAQVCFSPMEFALSQIDAEKERSATRRGDPNRNEDGPRELSRTDQQKIAAKMVEKIGMPVAEWAIDDSALAEHLVVDHPALASAVIMILLFAMPILVCMGASNQTSGDVQTKSLRYLLLRVDRGSLLLGRFFGSLLFTVVMLSILLLVVFLYLVGKSDFYDTSDVASWMLLRGLFALIFFAMPYVALCTWISANVASPRLSLVTCELASFAIPVLVYIGKSYQEDFKYVNYVTPWPLKFELLHYDPAHVIGATAAMIGFTALFLFLGLYTFNKRDL